ncbi:hypothetical protein ACIPSA_47065 [Streptomyces sp. NPDC086549]|uniref:hypothetical protein n=1 Tax=Streptomyces sp. NPDC086549 TaxID=3365752 RepID=UPI003815A0A3
MKVVKVIGRLSIPVAMGLVLAATGVSSAAASAVSPAPRASAANGPVLELTAADNGKTVTVDRDDIVTVFLTSSTTPGPGTVFAWSAPTSSDSNVLAEAASIATPNGDAHAIFRATGSGSATLSAVRGCKIVWPGHPCTLPLLLWSVTVNVQ